MKLKLRIRLYKKEPNFQRKNCQCPILGVYFGLCVMSHVILMQEKHEKAMEKQIEATYGVTSKLDTMDRRIFELIRIVENIQNQMFGRSMQNLHQNLDNFE